MRVLQRVPQRGRIVIHGTSYEHPALCLQHGGEVKVAFDPTDLGSVYVYDKCSRPLCVAKQATVGPAKKGA